MPAPAQSDLAREYLAWLKDRITTIDRGEVSILATPFLDPLSFNQLRLLKRMRTGADDPELLTAVLECINGIASGL